MASTVTNRLKDKEVELEGETGHLLRETEESGKEGVNPESEPLYTQI